MLLSMALSAHGQGTETKRTLTPAQEADLKRSDALTQQVIERFQKQAYGEALPLAQQAFEIQLRILGEDDPATQTAMSDLVMLLKLNREYAKALPILERIAKWRRPHFGPQSPELSETLNDLGLCHYQLEQFEPAYQNFREALQIREALFGKVNESTIQSLNNTGRALQMLGRYAEARAQFEQVLEVFQKELGAEHERTATSLNDVAINYKLAGQTQEARKLYEQALAIRRKLYGDDHVATGISQGNLGLLLQEEGEFAAALPLTEAALKNARKHSGERSSEAAISYVNLAMLQQATEQWKAAEQNFEIACDIAREVNGEDSLQFAQFTNNLGAFYAAKGDFRKAKPYFESSLKTRLAMLGDSHPDVALSYSNLGRTQTELGEYAAAQNTIEQGLTTVERTLGLKHPLRGVLLMSQGELLEQQGKSVESRKRFQEVLDLRREVLGELHPGTLEAMVSLGNALIRMGDPEKGADYLLQVYDSYKKVYGADHAKTATPLNNLASFLNHAGKIEEARNAYLRVLEIRKKSLGDDNFETAVTLNNLATVEFDLGHSQIAVDYQQQALKIQRKRFGEEHRDVARSLLNLAYFMGKDPSHSREEVEKAYQGAIALQKKVLGATHPDLVDPYNNFALYQVAQGQPAAALKSFDQARHLVLDSMREVLPSLNESEQLSVLLDHEHKLFAPLSLCVAQRTDQRFVDRSAEWLLNAKGLSQTALAMQNQRLMDTQAQKGVIRDSEAAIRLPDWTSLDAVRKTLQVDEVLLEFVSFNEFDFAAKDLLTRWKPPRYAVWVIPPAGKAQVRLIELGSKQEIDDAITRTRERIMDIKAIQSQGDEQATQTVIGELRKLSQRLLTPLREEIATAEHLLISPDSNLWLVPWNAMLLDEKDRYLIEDKSIQLMISGRDRLHTVSSSTAGQPAAVFANPQYDLAPQSVWEAIRAVLRQQSPTEEDRQRSVSFAAPRSLPKVAPLPASAMEAELIAPSLKTLTGMEPLRYQDQYALEQVVKSLSKPRVLMISTHGFYLDTKQTEQNVELAQLNREVTAIDNPLLRCGLMFAGCNDPKAGQATAGDDGVLTGMEIIALDLQGTELVMLSACETGVGQVRNGEGVAGLRQAFQLAGAKAIVATLWSIPDRDSALLVNQFFQHIAEEQTQEDALRQAQIDRIEKRRARFGAAHPFYWAAFSLTSQ